MRIFKTRIKGRGGTWLESRKTVEERTLVRSWPRRRGQKSTSTVGKLRFFRGLAGSINLCGNFRQEPNAERSGYYISPVEVSKKG